MLGAALLNTPARRLLRLELPSGEREPDRYAAGLRFTGKWVLRLGIVLMGLKVQTSFFGAATLLLIAGVAVGVIPSVFFVTHALATSLAIRRPMARPARRRHHDLRRLRRSTRSPRSPAPAARSRSW